MYNFKRKHNTVQFGEEQRRRRRHNHAGRGEERLTRHNPVGKRGGDTNAPQSTCGKLMKNIEPRKQYNVMKPSAAKRSLQTRCKGS